MSKEPERTRNTDVNGNEQGKSKVANVSGVDEAKSAARNLLDAVGEIQLELEAQVIQLQSQLSGYELTVSILRNQVKHLQNELANQPDCDGDDGYPTSKTPDELSGFAPPPANSGVPS